MVEGGNSMETVSQCVLIDFSPFSVVDFGFGVFFDVFIFFPSIFKKTEFVSVRNSYVTFMRTISNPSKPQLDYIMKTT